MGFAAIRQPVLLVWNCFCDCGDSFARNLDLLQKLLRNLQGNLTNLLKNHLTPTSLNSIKELFDFCCNMEHLQLLMESGKHDGLVKETIKLLRDAWIANVPKHEQNATLQVSMSLDS